MYASWYERTGPADQVLQFGEIEIPSPGPDDVLVRVHTSGVNPSDTKGRNGNSRRPGTFSRIIPHSDGAGVIEAVGDAVSPSRVGERVWLWNAQFGRSFGTAAEYVVLPSIQAVHLPDSVDFAAGACLGIPALTAHACLFGDGPIQGQTVLISGGAGAVGHAAIQLAKWGGATVITTISSPEKEAVARSAGADYVLNYKNEDIATRIDEITQHKGVDRIVDVAFGQNVLLDTSVIKRNGVIAIYGSDAEAYPRLPLFELLIKDITIHLVLVYILPDAARERGLADVNAALEAEALRPIIGARFPLRETVQAHQALESGNVIGNVVIDVAESSPSR
ncbi:MAG: NADPH:quinone reductase [Candidatus Udaeobacter sp.]